jgi:hypothetical protein
MMLATLLAESRALLTLPLFVIGRNRAPSAIELASSHARNALTGQLRPSDDWDDLPLSFLIRLALADRDAALLDVNTAQLLSEAKRT